MKKHKKIIAVMTVIFGIISGGVYASDSDVVVSLTLNNPIMQINGQAVEIDEGRGTVPLALENRTLVPIRAIIEAFGGTVGWNGGTNTVSLSMNGDEITLTIDSKTASINGKNYTLDSVPKVINERTMLPIRFIAEGFKLGVGWDGKTQTVYIVRNLFDEQEYAFVKNAVGKYSGEPYVTLNDNLPLFCDYEIIPASFEYYSKLDELGRCDVAMSSVGRDLMPEGDRESILSVTPTGWINKRYNVVSGGYLYNRCHLIGYQLTGENANKRNLITGTRYLNTEGMLPFENMIDDYIEKTGNHVMYRVTPVFSDNNLLADGVLLEGYSVEDKGTGVSFCVYCYNVQPSVVIDYRTGDSRLDTKEY